MTQPDAEFLALQTALAGEYSLQRELGRGGMGIVYLARDVQLDRDVAIKVLPAHLASTAESRERFLREARTAAGLSHPHIVPIHRVGESAGFVYFVMSYVEGETLGERLRRDGPLPPADATRVLREVAWALAYAHGRGIVHRDVKPDNILLEAGTGRALVTDFGIAHGGTAAAANTDPGKIMGTANFMSPEQAAGEPIDGRSDMYALGVVGYLAVSGRLPFEASNLPALLVRQATERAPSVLGAAPGLPPALGSAIDRCLAREPALCFPNGEALAAALAPAPEVRPALPTTLRAWLGARNPLLVPYMAWSGLFSVLTAGNIYANAIGNPGSSWGDVVLLASIASAPLLPIVGFHLNQARRQFRAGHTLADLRSALEIARRERAESEALAREEGEPVSYRMLRLATVASSTWLATTFVFLQQGVIHENRTNLVWIFGPILSTLLLGAASNALDVQFIPTKLRDWWQTGIRDRLWNSRAGAWLAKRLGAPDRSRAIGGGVFRATESAFGVAGRWGNDVVRLEPLSGGFANDVWSVRVAGQLAIGRLGTRSEADLPWKTDLLQHLDNEGLIVPVPLPTTHGRLFVVGVVVMTCVEGRPPATEADWHPFFSSIGLTWVSANQQAGHRRINQLSEHEPATRQTFRLQVGMFRESLVMPLTRYVPGHCGVELPGLMREQLRC